MESRSERFNFKYYIKNVKEGKIPWEFFASLMKDLSQTLVSAQKLNDLLLDELKFSIENLSLKSESIKNESNVEELCHYFTPSMMSCSDLRKLL